MERGLKSAEAYRATALHCRQLAADDPDNRWRLLSEAERWEYLAEQILASRQRDRAAEIAEPGVEAALTGVPPSPSKTAPSRSKTAQPRPRAPARPPRKG